MIICKTEAAAAIPKIPIAWNPKLKTNENGTKNTANIIDIHIKIAWYVMYLVKILTSRAPNTNPNDLVRNKKEYSV